MAKRASWLKEYHGQKSIVDQHGHKNRKAKE